MNILLRLFRPLVNAEIEKRLKERAESEEKDYREAQRKLKAPAKRSFTSGGTQYYQLKDLFNQNCLRSFAAISFYEELRMKCTREFLVEHLEKQKELKDSIKNSLSITNGTLNLQLSFELIEESITLDGHIEERLKLIYEPDSVMKLASIVFFDSKEDPLNYDHAYGIEKVNRWKKEGIDGFFLSKHMKDLVDYSSIKESDFQKYTEVANLMTKEHLDALSSTLSTSLLTSD